MLFPFEVIRPEQEKMIKDVQAAVASGSNLIAHAPTGLGKTAAVLAPTLKIAIEKGLTIFFLTSRHTQHAIAIETLKLIKEKHNVNFTVVDIVGKKNMCARPEADGFIGRQFHEYCRALREKDDCDFFLNFKKNSELTASSKHVLNFIRSMPVHTEEVVSSAKQQHVCPYEIAAHASKEATVIIADYYTIFNPSIRESFFKRNSKTLDRSIIIVDEAHNLPGRMREMLTEKLSDFVLSRAIKEAEKWEDDSIHEFLTVIQNGLHSIAGEEKIVPKEQLLQFLEKYDLPLVLERMSVVAESVRESDNQSFIGSVADFLSRWQSGDEGFARILSSRETSHGLNVTLTYQCLDPSLEAKSVIDSAHSVIMMSGTLTPLFMYRDLLGFPKNTVLKEYENPFPKENVLSLIVRGATTRYSQRNNNQYRKLAEICNKASNSIPGNTAIFFPSYFLMEQVHVNLSLNKKVYKEHPNMSKQEKQALLNDFKQEWFNGGVLLAVIGGSFSEGIDLPSHFLKGVIIVGLPLTRPDLFTKELINYYQRLYHKGWDYGYTYPAFTKALQSAGRCIRTETDRGVILFVDERYAWDRYYACFPKNVSPKITSFYQNSITEFFENNIKK